MKKFLLTLLVLFAAFALFANAETESATGAKSVEYEDEIRLLLSGYMNYSCPHVTYGADMEIFLGMVYEPLLKKDANTGELIPCLAKSAEFKDDACKILHVVLRDDVYYTNGAKFNAEQVAFNFGDMTYSAITKFYDHCEVVGEYEVDIYLKQSNSNFKNLLANGFTYMIEMGDKKANGESAKVGTGRYVFEEGSFIPGNTATLVRNENYWGELLPTKKIVCSMIANESTRLIAVQAGEADLTRGVSADEMDIASGDKSLSTLMDWTSNSFLFFGFNNMRKEEIDDINFRYAVACAIDKEEVMKAGSNEYASVAYGICGKSFNGYVVESESEFGVDLSYNPEKAKEYLSKTNKREFTILVKNTTENKTVAQVIQQQLKRVGITMNIEETDATGFTANSKWATASYEATVHNNTLSRADSGMDYVTPNSNVNKVCSNDSKGVELMKKFYAAKDPAEAQRLAKEVQKLLHDTGTVVMLYYKPIMYAYNKNISGLNPYMPTDMAEVVKAK